MDLGLAGKRALVTAASRGLGRACAEVLAAEGARVFICARASEAVSLTADAIGGAGWTAADLAVPGEPERVVAQAVSALGGLDILVANVGGPVPGSFESQSDQAWDSAYQLLLMSAVRLARASLPHLKTSGSGRIVNITSVAVREPVGNLLLSNSLRAAVTGMAKTLSGEMAGFGITVNNIAPNNILTDRIRQLHASGEGSAEEQLSRAAAATPSGRWGDPQEVGALCAYLCSDRAGYISGQTIAIDGGAGRAV